MLFLLNLYFLNSIIFLGCDYMIYIWIAIVIILAIVELMTSRLITIWFSISGVFSIVTSIFFNSYIIRLIVFFLGGFILLTIFRPILISKRGDVRE